MKTIDHYDKDYWKVNKKSYGVMRRREIVALKFLSKISSKMKSPKILDAACGDGRFLVKLRSKIPNADFYGIDYSAEGLRIAKKNKLKVKKADLNVKIPYKSKSFDVVHSAENIEHLYDPDKLLQEANRVLKSKGFLVVSTPNLCAWFNRLLFLFGIHPLYYEVSTKSSLFGLGFLKRLKAYGLPVGHIRVFSYKALKDILGAYGFKVVKVKTEVFEDGFPKIIWPIDKFFSLFPSLSSHLIVVAQKMK